MSWRSTPDILKHVCPIHRVIGRSSTQKSKARPSRYQRALCDSHYGVRQHSAVTLPPPSGGLASSYSSTMTLLYQVFCNSGGAAIRRLPSNTVLLNLHDTALRLAFKSIWSAEMYRVRFLLIILRCLISATAPVESERRLSFRAVPFIDTDITRMFTHSYALFMGLARWHLLFGSQFRKLALRHKWAPVTTGEMINYRRSIRAFQKFELRTRVIYW